MVLHNWFMIFALSLLSSFSTLRSGRHICLQTFAWHIFLARSSRSSRTRTQRLLEMLRKVAHKQLARTSLNTPVNLSGYKFLQTFHFLFAVRATFLNMVQWWPSFVPDWYLKSIRLFPVVKAPLKSRCTVILNQVCHVIAQSVWMSTHPSRALDFLARHRKCFRRPLVCKTMTISSRIGIKVLHV